MKAREFNIRIIREDDDNTFVIDLWYKDKHISTAIYSVEMGNTDAISHVLRDASHVMYGAMAEMMTEEIT